MSNLRLIATLLVLVGAGCDTERTSPPGGQEARVSLSGPVASFAGRGFFWTTPGATPRTYNVVVRDTVDGVPRELHMRWVRGDQPPVDNYGVGDHASAERARAQVSAVFTSGSLVPPDTLHAFASEGGSVRLQRSTGAEMAGSFEMSMAEYCVRSGGDVQGSCVPTVLDASAPRATVRGTFAAVARGPMGAPVPAARP
jgi:hypothetical protein